MAILFFVECVKMVDQALDKFCDIAYITYMTSSLLRAIRAQLNITQEQLAERLGVSFATVNRWEGGANTPQKAARDAILALAEEAGLEVENGESAAVVPRAGRPRPNGRAGPTTT